MKKLILFLLLPLFGMGQQQVIKYPGYTIYWNPKTLIADSTIWMCIPHAKICGREAGFHATGGRVNQASDYSHSGYDIGHNGNASDFNGNKADEYNSFDYANAMPELPNLNRLTWLALENYCRKISPCKVKVTWSGIKTHIGKDNVTVPLYCIKEVWCKGHYEKYVFPNMDTVNRHLFTYYKVK